MTFIFYLKKFQEIYYYTICICMSLFKSYNFCLKHFLLLHVSSGIIACFRCFTLLLGKRMEVENKFSLIIVYVND